MNFNAIRPLVKWSRLLVIVATLHAGGAYAQIATCDRADVTDAAQVASCMASLAGPRAAATGFQQWPADSCASAAQLYVSTLVRLGKQSFDVPDCPTIAAALTMLQKRAPPWRSCAHYSGQFDAREMRACLRGYGGQGRFSAIRNCAEAIQLNEEALRHANITIDRESTIPVLPANYVAPTCQQVDTVFAAEASQPANPPGPPPLAAPPSIARQNQTGNDSQVDTSRPGSPSATPKEGQPTAKTDRPSPPPHREPTAKPAERGWIAAVANFLRMDRPGVLWAIAVHGIFSAWTLLYARQRFQRGQWVRFSPRFQMNVTIAQIFLVGVGMWRTGFGWLPWALLVFACTKLLKIILSHFGAFDLQALSAGPESQGPTRQPSSDDGGSRRWT